MKMIVESEYFKYRCAMFKQTESPFISAENIVQHEPKISTFARLLNNK